VDYLMQNFDGVLEAYYRLETSPFLGDLVKTGLQEYHWWRQDCPGSAGNGQPTVFVSECGRSFLWV